MTTKSKSTTAVTKGRGNKAVKKTATESTKPAAKAKTPKKTAIDVKLSQLAAAARVLVEAGQPLNCKAMVEAMSAKGYWSSPGGKTPEATLYASLLRHIQKHGKAARFVKTDRGLFTLASK
jgi:HB1, ASXL, restriction endonuclease HTH domain